MPNSVSDADRQRLFVAFPIPTAVGKEAITGLEEHWPQALPGITRVEQWHCTQLFLGEVARTELPNIKSAIRNVAVKSKAYVLKEGRLVAMPPERPRMAWIRFAASNEHETLHHSLAKALSVATDDRRPFWPHITLTRKLDRIGDLPNIEGALIRCCTVDRMVLFCSLRMPQGMMHMPLEGFALRY